MADDQYTLSGESIVRTYDAVRRVHSSVINPLQRPARKDRRQQRWIPCRNDSTTEIAGFGFVKITGATTDGALTVTAPTTAYSDMYAVNGSEPIAAGNGGLCTFDSPVTLLYSTSATPAVGEGYGVKPNQVAAEEGFYGARVLGIVDSASRLMLAELTLPFDGLLCKTVAAFSAGSASTGYRIYAGPTLGSETDAGFGNLPPALSLVALSSGIWGRLQHLANGKRIEPLECSS